MWLKMDLMRISIASGKEVYISEADNPRSWHWKVWESIRKKTKKSVKDLELCVES